jgi:cyanophycinase
MNSQQRLFLLGGSPIAFDSVADEFVPAAGGRGAGIALLLEGAPGWEEYVPQYTRPWTERGVTRHYTIVPDAAGSLDLETASARLREATGIFVGGGNTPNYRRLFAIEPIRSLIRDRYEQGVPIAGLSAGALIAPAVCAIPPEDTGGAAVAIAPGLGLVDHLLVGVHFTEWNALPHLLEAMRQTGTAVALGIDEAACVVLEDGQVKQVLGRSAYEIRMADFTSGTYRITELGPCGEQEDV